MLQFIFQQGSLSLSGKFSMNIFSCQYKVNIPCIDILYFLKNVKKNQIECNVAYILVQTYIYFVLSPEFQYFLQDAEHKMEFPVASTSTTCTSLNHTAASNCH